MPELGSVLHGNMGKQTCQEWTPHCSEILRTDFQCIKALCVLTGIMPIT